MRCRRCQGLMVRLSFREYTLVEWGHECLLCSAVIFDRLGEAVPGPKVKTPHPEREAQWR